MNKDSSNQSSISDPKDWTGKHGDALFGYAFRCLKEHVSKTWKQIQSQSATEMI